MNVAYIWLKPRQLIDKVTFSNLTFCDLDEKIDIVRIIDQKVDPLVTGLPTFNFSTN
jgi:hypothetical protein